MVFTYYFDRGYFIEFFSMITLCSRALKEGVTFLNFVFISMNKREKKCSYSLKTSPILISKGVARSKETDPPVAPYKTTTRNVLNIIKTRKT